MPTDRSAFSVTCPCGETIHTSDEHVGRTIRCRCGRPITIQRPPAATPQADVLFSAAKARSKAASGKRAHRPADRPAAQSTRRKLHVGQLVLAPARAIAADITSHARMRRWVTLASMAVLACTIASWLLLITASEEFIPATLLAYGPRVVVLVPITVGAIASLVWARASLMLHVASASIALLGIMGARLHVVNGRGPIPPADVAQVRVLSLNAEGGAVALRHLPALVAEVKPDLVDVQECGESLAAALERAPGYHAARYANLCVLSRWPMSPPDSMPRAAFARVSALGYGGTALVVRYRIAHPTHAMDFVTLHLETPRKGLERLMGGDGFIPDSGGVPRLHDVEGEQLNARIRRMESERASVWSARFADSLPVIVAGDFNMPVESSIFRQFWTRFDDAFDESGLGLGYTKFENRYIKARIDHVLFAPNWMEARGAWVGPEVGSDHRPVIADLRLRR